MRGTARPRSPTRTSSSTRVVVSDRRGRGCSERFTPADTLSLEDLLAGQVTIGGQAAESADFVDAVYGNFPLTMPRGALGASARRRREPVRVCM